MKEERVEEETPFMAVEEQIIKDPFNYAINHYSGEELKRLEEINEPLFIELSDRG
jgi:hypothetical protein